MKADVSVIIPVYNSAEKARRAVASVARQTLLPKEVIIVDDCSTESNTRFILESIKKEYQQLLDIKIIFQVVNKGAGETRNTGWKIAKEKYIAFLDSDDIWHPNKLEIQYKYMLLHEDVYFSCHHMDVITEGDINKFGNIKVTYSRNEEIKISFFRYLFKHYPRGGTPSVMLRNIDGHRFRIGKRYSEDYLLWLQYCHDYQGALLNLALAASFKEIYGENGLSANLFKIEQGELETFKILYREKYINILTLFLCSTFSVVKFLRRCLIVLYRKHIIMDRLDKKGKTTWCTPPRDK